MPPTNLLSPSTPVLILPGYGSSGPLHWQTLWEKQHPHFRRVEEKDWESPVCSDWVNELEAAVQASEPGIILIAHSLACLQVAHWVQAAIDSSPSMAKIGAAFLVAPPDPQSAVFPDTIQGFSPVPLPRFPFPTLVVGSTNDPYATSDFTEASAMAWGARFVSAGPLGHINAASGLGDWPDGMKLLTSLLR